MSDVPFSCEIADLMARTCPFGGKVELTPTGPVCTKGCGWEGSDKGIVDDKRLSNLQVDGRAGSNFWGNHGHGDRSAKDGRKSKQPVVRVTPKQTLQGVRGQVAEVLEMFE